MALTLGQTIAPETSPYFAPDLPRGWPCLQMTCVTEKGTGLLAVEVTHFAATVNLATMMTTPPQPDDQLVFFMMITDAKTTGKIVISTL